MYTPEGARFVKWHKQQMRKLEREYVKASTTDERKIELDDQYREHQAYIHVMHELSK